MIATIHDADPERSIRRRCARVGAGRTWSSTHPSPDQVTGRDTALHAAIERLVREFPGDGDRRVTKALQRAGWVVNPKRVLRVMRQESLLGQLERRLVVITDAAHGLRTSPNLPAAATLTGRDQAWVAAMTSIRLPTTFASLACLLDAWSRRWVGWHLSRAIATTLTLAALDHTLTARPPAPGLIYHSDRGVQYAGGVSVERLPEAGARISMATVGNPTRTPRPRASSRRSNGRRSPATTTRRFRKPTRTWIGASRMSTMPSGCIRASTIGRRSSSRRSTRQWGGIHFYLGSQLGVHSTDDSSGGIGVSNCQCADALDQLLSTPVDTTLMSGSPSVKRRRFSLMKRQR